MNVEITESGKITFESVKNQSTEEYFKGNQFAIDAFNSKYKAFEKETYVEAVWRVCQYMASCEKPEIQKYWAERWFDEIYNDWWHPAGSIMQGAGSKKSISLANCTTVNFGTLKYEEEWDSLESIVKNAAYNVAKMAAFRQGLGLDFSRLRPSACTVYNSSNISQGSIHWMRFIDNIGYYVGQSGRIPALLFSLSVSHPDVIDFINVKSDRTKIQNANISVQCTDAFYEAVRNNADWELKFEIPEVKKGDKIWIDVHSTDKDSFYDEKEKKYYYIARKNRPYERINKTVKAKELMELIAKQMYINAEPGIQNIDIARKYSNSDYVYDSESLCDSRICSTNACSEQYLSPESTCILASENAGKFSAKPEIFEKEQEVIASSINRFLDNVNEMELREGTFATPFQKTAIEMLRRTGAGFTNIAAWLVKINLEYGTLKGNEAVAHFMERYNYHLYKNSISLGHEKGSFGLFNREKFEKSPFIQRMMTLGLTFDAMRNVTCTSVAPTGTLSLLFRDLVLSYGIEPAFGMYYWKRTRISGHYEYYFCVPTIIRQVLKENGIDLPINSDAVKDTWDGQIGKPLAEIIDNAAKTLDLKFKRATDVSPFEKLDLMSKVMKWCDSSISVTYMLPTTTTYKDVFDFIMLAHEKEVKSIAAFPDRKMYGIVSYIPFKELAVELVKEGTSIHPQNFVKKELDELQKLTNTIVEKDNDVIVRTTAPERPKSLNCDVHHIKFTKKDKNEMKTFNYLVVIGLLKGMPYELFCMENGRLDKKYTKGILTREKSGVYAVAFEDGTEIDDVTKNTSESEDMITRGFSMALRHGADISVLVEQLEKAEVDPKLKMWSFSSAMGRALKKYIGNNTIVQGETCQNCGSSNIVRLEGCKSCSDCGSSRCS